jgi:hypothetical protein
MVGQAHVGLSRALADSTPWQTVEEGAMHTAEIFRNVHSMLTHTSNISRLLWPGDKVKPSRKQRAQELRALIAVPDENHILSDRSLRDHLEHFDERLDAWVARSGANPDFWQDFIGSWEVIANYKAMDENVMRHFDPCTKTFRFQGYPWDVAEMIDAVQELRRRVDAKVVELMSLLYPPHDPPAYGKIFEG